MKDEGGRMKDEIRQRTKGEDGRMRDEAKAARAVAVPSSLIPHPSSFILGPPPSAPAATRNSVFLPIVAAQTDPVAEFSRLLVADPRQQRTSLGRCPALQQAAVWRAWGLANGQPWSHIDKEGTWPNKRARLAGCHLPNDYSDDENYVESLVAGTADPYTAFGALALSPHHKVHLFGENTFFQQQRHFGIALCAGGEMRWYWAILIATCLGQTSGE